MTFPPKHPLGTSNSTKHILIILTESFGHSEKCCNYYCIQKYLTLDLSHKGSNLCTLRDINC